MFFSHCLLHRMQTAIGRLQTLYCANNLSFEHTDKLNTGINRPISDIAVYMFPDSNSARTAISFGTSCFSLLGCIADMVAPS